MTTLIAKPYRRKFAQAAFESRTVPRVKQIALGTGSTPWSPDDEGLEAEIPGTRKDLDSSSIDDLVVDVIGTILGAEIGDNEVNEVGYYDSEGGFVAREVVKPKQFEAETSIRIESHLQF